MGLSAGGVGGRDLPDRVPMAWDDGTGPALPLGQKPTDCSVCGSRLVVVGRVTWLDVTMKAPGW